MDLSLIIPDISDRTGLYEALLPQAAALLKDEPDPIARMANLAAVIHQAFKHHWVGFYRVQGEELVLGPFQGPVACTRIPRGKGVCGTAWAVGRPVIVDDVDSFPGHIACSPLSRSEIVIPVHDESGAVWAVLDIDSTEPAAFEQVDAHGLGQLVALLCRRS